MNEPHPLPDPQDLHSRKAALRAELRKRRLNLGPIQRPILSGLVADRLHQILKLRNLKVFALYHPTATEVDLTPYFPIWNEDGLTVLLPRVVSQGQMVMAPWKPGDPMVKNRHHIFEPVSPAWHGAIDGVVVPGLGFDRHKRRLGNGGGYYDRFLADNPKCSAIGVFFACQEVSEIPVEAHDRRLDLVITEGGVH